jgi:sugar-specific transcriptional regulator TrmB
MENMIKEKLEKIGLTPGESEVYEILIEIGTAKAGTLIKKANLASSKVYDVLQRLVNKGLVSFMTQNGVKYYDATPPERLVDFLEEKRDDLKTAQSEIQKIIPIIKEKKESLKETNNVRMYLGKQGPKIVLKELAEESRKEGINYGYGTPENPFAEHYPHDLKDFFKAEKKYKLTTKLLFAQGHKQKQPNAKIKYLPPEFISPVRTMIAGNKVFLVDFVKPITSIIIENKQVAKSYKEHFEILWKTARP